MDNAIIWVMAHKLILTQLRSCLATPPTKRPGTGTRYHKRYRYYVLYCRPAGTLLRVPIVLTGLSANALVMGSF